MATKKVVTESTSVSTTKVKMERRKEAGAKSPLGNAGVCYETGISAKSCRAKLATAKKKKSAKKVQKKKSEIERNDIVNSDRVVRVSGYSERRALRVELADVKDTTVSVETLKIGLLLAAIDGHCDKDEIAKFRKIAESCGGFSEAKISQIIAQTQRRISVLEDSVRNGAAEDDTIENFLAEASNIGIQMNSRNFVFWMSIAMVDGDFSSIERKAIMALRDHARKSFSGLGLFSRGKNSDVSDLFLKRCEMILAGVYKADAAGSKRLLQNRMKSLQTLVEIADA